jgi:hypothetical protein
MQNRVVLSIVLGAFVLGMTSYLPSVYAVDTDYDTRNQGQCQIIPAPTTWSDLLDVCTLNGNWDMGINDHLTVSFGTNFVIASGSSLTNVGKITIDSDGTTGLVNSGFLLNGEEASITIGSVLRNEAGALFRNEGVVNGVGSLVNLGNFESAAGTVSVPTVINSNIVKNEGSSTFIVAEQFTNESTGGVQNNGATFIIQGNFDNFGELFQDGGLDISGIFTNYPSGFITNQGSLTLDASGDMINGGEIYASEDSSIEFDHSFTNLSTGVFENDGEIVIEKDGQIINSGTFASNGLITLASAPPEFSRINTTVGDFTNNDIITNQCGIITGTILGMDPTDACYGYVLFSTPADESIFDETDDITFTATATDKDEFGNESDISEFIVWTEDGNQLGLCQVNLCLAIYAAVEIEVCASMPDSLILVLLP